MKSVVNNFLLLFIFSFKDGRAFCAFVNYFRGGIDISSLNQVRIQQDSAQFLITTTELIYIVFIGWLCLQSRFGLKPCREGIRSSEAI